MVATGGQTAPDVNFGRTPGTKQQLRYARPGSVSTWGPYPSSGVLRTGRGATRRWRKGSLKAKNSSEGLE